MINGTHDIRKRAFSKLMSLRNNVNEIAGQIDEKYVLIFHEALDELKTTEVNVDDLRIPKSEIKPKQGAIRTISNPGKPAGTGYSNEKYVDKHYLLLKVDAIIAYLNELNIPNNIGSEISTAEDPRKVFVVHGRNLDIRNAMFIFLRSIGLIPIEWAQAVEATGKASPYIGEILDKAFFMAQAILVIMTPDDEAQLRQHLRKPDDPPHEIKLTPQPRPNVLFEAGMAMGRAQDRTVIVEVGNLRPFTDIGGRHLIRLDNTTQRRQELAQRLKTAGCHIDCSGTNWHTAGNFEIVAAENDPKEYQKMGLCIRCGVDIPLNPEKPLCRECFSVWVQWENPEYEEKFCHICGKRELTTMAKPLCYACFQEDCRMGAV